MQRTHSVSERGLAGRQRLLVRHTRSASTPAASDAEMLTLNGSRSVSRIAPRSLLPGGDGADMMAPGGRGVAIDSPGVPASDAELSSAAARDAMQVVRYGSGERQRGGCPVSVDRVVLVATVAMDDDG